MSTADQRIEEGLRRHRAGDLEAARAEYRAALEVEPDHVRALRLLGTLCWQLGDAAGALERLDRAFALAPADVDVVKARGAALLLAGRAHEAAAAFATVLAHDPDDTESAFNMGLAEQRLGNRAGAAALFRRVLVRRPDFAPARTALEDMNESAAPPLHVMIGTPCFGGNVTDHYTISLLNLQAACLKRGIRLSFCLLHGDALITRARNSVVAEFLKDTTATHLFFIDADIGFSPAQAFRLIDAGFDMAAAAYPVKHLDWRRADGGAPAASFDYVVEFCDADGRPTKTPVDAANGFARARYVGTGFLLVRRVVFERMAAHYPDTRYRTTHASADADIREPLHAFFDCRIDPASGIYLSEDFTFCQRWLEMGGEIQVDVQSRLTHVGRHPFEGDLGARHAPPAAAIGQAAD